MPIEAGTLLAISALSALAQAGGAGAAGYFGAKAEEDALKLKKRQMLQEQQNIDEDRRIADSRYNDAQATQHRQEMANKPMESINMLSGLSNLRQGMGRSSNLDVLGYLSRG